MSSDHLLKHRRDEAARKRQAVLTGIADVLAKGEQNITPTTVAAAAGVSREYIYRQPDLRRAVADAAEQQARPAGEPAQLKALKSEAARLRERLKTERQTNLDLRKQLRRAWGSAIEDVPAADLTQRIVDLEQRNSELARQLREVENDRADKEALLEQATEQLDSARTLNRELMREQNRVPDVGHTSDDR